MVLTPKIVGKVINEIKIYGGRVPIGTMHGVNPPFPILIYRGVGIFEKL